VAYGTSTWASFRRWGLWMRRLVEAVEHNSMQILAPCVKKRLLNWQQQSAQHHQSQAKAGHQLKQLGCVSSAQLAQLQIRWLLLW